MRAAASLAPRGTSGERGSSKIVPPLPGPPRPPGSREERESFGCGVSRARLFVPLSTSSRFPPPRSFDAASRRDQCGKNLRPAAFTSSPCLRSRCLVRSSSESVVKTLGRHGLPAFLNIPFKKSIMPGCMLGVENIGPSWPASCTIMSSLSTPARFNAACKRWLWATGTRSSWSP